MTKGKVVLVRFPFDDLSGSKVRPALCLNNPVRQHHHVILAFITSQIPSSLLETDYVVDTNHPDFAASGLHQKSTIRLDTVMTVRKSLLQRELGVLSLDTQNQIAEKLCKLLTK